MHICLYTETALPKVGGQELVVDALARQFQVAGHRVTVLAARPRRRWFVDDTALPYRVVRHWPFFSTHRLVGWYRRVLTSLYRRDPWDILHCQSTYPCGYLAALSGEAIPTPVVITSHGGDVRPGNVRLTKPAIRARCEQAIARADALVTISRFTHDAFAQLGARDDQLIAIPNGVDVEPYRRATPRPAKLDARIQPGRYLLFLGRLHERKGVDVAIDALAQLVPQDGVELVIAGAGDERVALEQQVARLKLAHRVCFVGPVRGDMKTYLVQQARALLMPTRTWEAFPLTVLEGFAAGKPVVGTRIPGLSDLIEPGRNGWLADPGSSQSLAEQWDIARQPEVYEQLRPTILAQVERFTWAKVVQEHLTLYERLLAQRARPIRQAHDE